jgi:uncharacterized membrane protein YkoI
MNNKPQNNLQQAVIKTAPSAMRQAIGTAATKTQLSTTKRLIYSMLSVMVIMLSIFTFSNQAKVMAYVTIDVNPTFELKLGRNYQVLNLVAIGADDTKVYTQLELSGLPLEDALIKLIDTLIEKGYLSIQENSMLISIDVQDNTNPEDLKILITDNVAKILASKEITPNVVTTATPRGGSKTTVKNTTTSTAKQQLMNALAKADSTLTLDQLAKLNIHELLILASLKQVDFSNVTVVGTANQSGLITKQQAIEIALNNASLTANQVQELEAEMETEDGLMIYEVEFTTNNQEYKYYINAINGTIIKNRHEIEKDDEDKTSSDKDDDDEDDESED